MLIKSSMESEELAYDTANIVYKRVGPTYDKWWMKEGYGQNYAWVVAEHSDYSVRLFFEFMDTGFCYVKVHFTNGASYEDLIADSWNYAKESPEYPFEETCDHVRNFLDNFFEVGGGMDKLRAKYEKGNNSYDVDSYIQNSRKSSRRPIESSTDWINKVPDGINLFLYSKDNHAKDKRYFPVGDDWGQTDRLLYAKMFTKDGMQKALSAIEPQLPEGMSIQVRDAKGKVYYTYPNNLTSSRRPIKSSDDNLPKEVYYIVVNGSKQYYEDYDEADDNLETLRAIGKGKVDGVYTETDPDEIYELYEVGYIGNSRRPVKSSFVVGKTMNDGSKLYYCEDNCFYDENNYTRPSIKIFNSKQEADKIAKRSKSGFVSPLEK